MSSSKKHMRLKDLGERTIVTDLIEPRFPVAGNTSYRLGDDCAVIPGVSDGNLMVMTIDPCPTPVVFLLDEPDFYHYGRMTVLISVSDLAAMGATPVGLTISSIMPEDMLVSDYCRFLDGVVEASNEWNTPVVGGNVKDGPEFTATSSALGKVHRDNILERKGARIGDKVCVIGEIGVFWAAVLSRVYKNIDISEKHKELFCTALRKPIPRIREGLMIAESRIATACMDASDGISGCLNVLAQLNQLDIVADLDDLTPHEAVLDMAEATDIDPRKLLLSWGDWQLVCAVPPAKINELETIMSFLKTPFHIIGEFCEGSGRVWLNCDHEALLSNFTSERFCKTSVFTHGLDSYFNLLKSQPLSMKPDSNT